MAAVTMPAGSANGSTARVMRSAPTTRIPPATIEAISGGREPPTSRSATCGTTKATNSSGPTAATDTEHSPTAATSTPTWVSWSRTPRPRAVSSPSSIALSDRTMSSDSGRSAASVSSTGTPCSQPREVSEPLSHTWALAASWIRAFTRRYDVPAISVAPRPIPTSTIRWTSSPRRHENR
jgi:hypothetical protein